MSGIELSQEQLEAVDKMKNGCILCGSVGSGKSRTALAYYSFKVCKSNKREMLEPRDLYIITTAKKRDSTEWIKECQPFMLNSNPETSISNVKVTVDSWNNIKKYKKVYSAFFIFDEQRLVGWGAWVKAFLDISRKNQWILLSATPGDTWTDYIAVFVANGFYRTKTEFITRHVVYAPYTKFPKITRYIDEGLLRKHRQDILVIMEDRRETIRHTNVVPVSYDIGLYRTVLKDRWNPYESEPIKESGKFYQLLRQVVNSDPSRTESIWEIMAEHPKVIIFYNFDYELEILRKYCEEHFITYSEWNGHKHEDIPSGKEWAYLVQYIAGSEGWNCITTDTMIFYSLSPSYRQTEQAAGRIDRMNTPYKDLYYYYLKSTASIDLSIHRSIRNKEDFSKSAFMKKNGIFFEK